MDINLNGHENNDSNYNFVNVYWLTAGVLSGLIGRGGGIIIVSFWLLMGFTQTQAQDISLAALLSPRYLAVIN